MLKQLLSVLGLSALYAQQGSALPDDSLAAAVATRPVLNLLGRGRRSAVFGSARNSFYGDPGGVHAKLTYRGGTHARNRGPAGHAGARAYNEYHSAPLDRRTAHWQDLRAQAKTTADADGADCAMSDFLRDADEQRNAAKARRRAIRKAGGQA